MVAAESPMKIFFPKLERVISVVTRAFSFFLDILGFHDHSWFFDFSLFCPLSHHVATDVSVG